MTFQPITKSFFGVPEDDEYFNLAAAADAYRQVMAMDEDAARYVVSSLLFDKTAEEIQKNQFKIQAVIDRYYHNQFQRIGQALKRSYISKQLKNEDTTELEQAYELLSKAFESEKHPRGGFAANPGQFSRMWGTHRTSSHGISYMQTKRAMSDAQAEKLYAIPPPGKGLTAQQRSEYQQAYHQVAQQLDRYSRVPGLASGASVEYVFEDRTGRRTSQVVGGLEPPAYAKNKTLVEFHVNVPSDVNLEGAGFNLLSALGGEQAGLYGTAALPGAGPALGTFQQEWNKPVYGGATNEPFYGRLGAASGLADALIPDTALKTKLAIKTGKFVGEYGPEAEKVLGPHARKSAYRYRGVEKAPDPTVVAQIDKLREASGGNRDLVRGEAIVGRAQAGARPGQMTQIENGFLTQYLANRLPKKDLSELQLKSGVTPPSQGFIINSKGQVVTEAVGYGDDHYLPFNLRNLGRLRGGEYIRTRATGGPTTEDIYAGLVSGARSLTVVSRSGVFQVNFDDTFRGNRRYSDKAARMVSRYGKLLDAVKEGNLPLQDISDERRAELQSDADRAFPYDKKQADQEFIRKLTAERKDPTPSAAEKVEMQRRAYADSRGDDLLRTQLLLEQEQAYKKAHKYETMKLNAQGYTAAMLSLKEQFPYYFGSIQHYPLREAEYQPNAKDRGYVKPRYLRPEGALEGYFDTSIQGAGTYTGEAHEAQRTTGKTTADVTNYANYRYNRLNPQVAAQIKARTSETGERTTTGAPASTEEKELREDQKAYAGYELYRKMRDVKEVQGFPMNWEIGTATTYPGLEAFLGAPLNQEEFVKKYRSDSNFVASFNKGIKVFSNNHPAIQPDVRKYEAARNIEEENPWSPEFNAGRGAQAYAEELNRPIFQAVAEEAQAMAGGDDIEKSEKLIEHYTTRLETRKREDRFKPVNRTEALSPEELNVKLERAKQYRLLLRRLNAERTPPLVGQVDEPPTVRVRLEDLLPPQPQLGSEQAGGVHRITGMP